jgi:predicted negative regulator of RcsB-dependent stress response
VEDYLSEKEQWEWVKAQVRENAAAVAVALLVCAGGYFGYRAWQAHLDTGRVEAAAKYTQMSQALEAADRTKALMLLGELERDHAGSPYTDQAKLLAARLYVTGNELDRAASELDAVAQHSKDPELALLARLRLARVQIAQGKTDAALATLAATELGAFAPRFHEARGDAYFAKGDKGAALKEYQAAQSGGSDPQLALKIADVAPAQPAATAAAAPPPAAAQDK